MAIQMATCDPNGRDEVSWGDHIAGAAALTRLHDWKGGKDKSQIGLLMEISYSSV